MEIVTDSNQLQKDNKEQILKAVVNLLILCQC